MKPEPDPVKKPEPVLRDGVCPDHLSQELIPIRRTIRRKIAIKTPYFWANGVDKTKKAMAVATLMVNANGILTGVSLKVGGKFFNASVLYLRLKGRRITYPLGTKCYIYVRKTIPPADGPGYVRKRATPMRPH